MMRCTVELECSESSKDQVGLLLRTLAGQTRSHEGCRVCRGCTDLFEGRRVYFMSEWNGRDDLERYVKSAAFLMLLSAMELSTVPPEVRFETVSESRGMEYIWEIRDGEIVGEVDVESRQETRT